MTAGAIGVEPPKIAHVRGVAVWLTVAVQPSGVKAIIGPTTPVLVRYIVVSHLTRRMGYSHSIVAGGFELTSYVTRFTPRISLMIRFEILPSTSCGNWNQSAVMPSRLVTARSATT